MRLAEKTVELTFCSQLSRRWDKNLFWFGLTQRQEAKAGFDAAFRTDGRLLIFQFKASSKIVRAHRRFHAPHGQLSNLVARCHGHRSVFYVLPALGSTSDVAGAPEIIDRCWLLDVDDLRDVEEPLTPLGTPRKNKTHYMDLEPPGVTIHDPIYKKLAFPALDLIAMDKTFEPPGMRTESCKKDGVEKYISKRLRFTGSAVALVVPS